MPTQLRLDFSQFGEVVDDAPVAKPAPIAPVKPKGLDFSQFGEEVAPTAPAPHAATSAPPAVAEIPQPPAPARVPTPPGAPPAAVPPTTPRNASIGTAAGLGALPPARPPVNPFVAGGHGVAPGQDLSEGKIVVDQDTFGALGDGVMEGAGYAASSISKTAQTAVGGTPSYEPPPQGAQLPDDWRDSKKVARWLGFQVGASAPAIPTMGGTAYLAGVLFPEAGVLGAAGAGAIGLGALGFAQSLGPRYAENLAAGMPKAQAFDKAFEDARNQGLLGAIAGGAFSIAPFKSALANIFLQSAAIQPAISVAAKIEENVAAGKDPLAGVAADYVSTAAGTLIPIAAFHAVSKVAAAAPNPFAKPAPAATGAAPGAGPTPGAGPGGGAGPGAGAAPGAGPGPGAQPGGSGAGAGPRPGAGPGGEQRRGPSFEQMQREAANRRASANRPPSAGASDINIDAWVNAAKQALGGVAANSRDAVRDMYGNTLRRKGWADDDIGDVLDRIFGQSSGGAGAAAPPPPEPPAPPEEAPAAAATRGESRTTETQPGAPTVGPGGQTEPAPGGNIQPAPRPASPPRGVNPAPAEQPAPAPVAGQNAPIDFSAYGEEIVGTGTRTEPVTVTHADDVVRAGEIVNPEPSEAQAAANNYQHGHVTIPGLEGYPISIETALGGTRRGTGADGSPWQVQMPAAYGYIRRTVGGEGEHLDVFLGPNPAAGTAFLIRQNTLEGKFDELKVVLGAKDAAEARDLYVKSFSSGHGEKIYGGIEPTISTVSGLKNWLKMSGGVATKPPAVDLRRTDLTPEQKATERDRRRLQQLKNTLDKGVHPQGRDFYPEERASWQSSIDELEAKIKAAEPAATVGEWHASASGGRFRQIGTNARGEPIYEDQRGVRHVTTAGGIRHTEPVSLRPTRNGGMEIGVDRTDQLDARFKPVQEGTSEQGPGVSPRTEPGDRQGAPAATGKLAGGSPAPGRAPGEAGEPPVAVPAGEVPAGGAEPVPAGVSALKRELIAGTLRTVAQARKIHLEAEPGRELTAKQLEEAIELALVLAGRDIVAEGKDPKATFKALLALYEKQPRLQARTGTSMANQAYSTPLPLGYLASRLADVKGAKSVLEPTAGNGALLLEANPAKTTANEIDPERRDALEAQGFRVSSKDATEGSLRHKGYPVDTVIMNPPFGKVRDGGGIKVFKVDGWTTRDIDHAIALNALKAMADDGRAVLIVAGTGGRQQDAVAEERDKARVAGYSTEGQREFNWRLYKDYNVVDRFTVNGKLYERQGAGWPVDVIVIHGRGKSSLPLPAAQLPPMLDSWEALEQKIGEAHARDRNQTANVAAGKGGGAAGVAPEREPGPEGGHAGGGEAPVGSRPMGRPGAAQPEPGPVRAGAGGGEPAGEGEPARPAPRVEPAGPGDDRGSGELPPARGRKPRVTNAAGQTTYQPASRLKDFDSLVPANMADAIQRSLARIEEKHGQIDEFVAKELGYPVGDLGKHFSAEQVDSLALAIDAVKNDGALVLGSQTGTGKGRVVAGMARWAKRNGMIPVLFTEKPDLFGDMYRDLRDIGMPDAKMVMTNAAITVPMDEEAVDWKSEFDDAIENGTKRPTRRGKFLRGGDAADQRALYGRIFDGSESPDIVFTTYDQTNTQAGKTTDRRRFLSAIADRAMLLFDESHNAGGQGDTGWKKADAPPNRAEFARELVDKAKGVLYSSATWAKRPDVMDLYRATDMAKAVENPKALPQLIQRGGVPLQQIVSAMLAEAGQYIRHERDFTGIEYSPELIHVDRIAYDHFTKAVRQIYEFDKYISDGKGESIKAGLMQQALASMGAAISRDNAVGDTGATSITFSSVMHNLVAQMLLSIQAKSTAERAIAAWKAGERPLIALANTMETALNDYAEMAHIDFGQPIDIDFSHLLNRYLLRSLRVTIKMPDKKVVHQQFQPEDLPLEAQERYGKAKAAIEAGDYSGMPVSPIDAMREAMEKAGMKVAEITGRQSIIKQGALAHRPPSEQGAAGKRVTIRKFQQGKIDAVIFNRSGSTGVSMHAERPPKSDGKKRRMLVAQAEPNVDTFMQTLGRINRNGQIELPGYSQLVPDVPAAVRPAAVLVKKMASLNANTTAARGSIFTREAVDFMNEYGDLVAERVLLADPELDWKLGGVLPDKEKGREGLARTMTGRLILLETGEQQAVIDRLQDDYRQLIANLDALGENMLEAKSVDLDAKLIKSEELKAAAGDNPFQGAVLLEKISIKAVGRSMSPQEVVEKVADQLQDKGTGITGTPAQKLYTLSVKLGEAYRQRYQSAREAFERWRKEVIDPIKSDDARTRALSRAEDEYARFRTLVGMLTPGKIVTLKTKNGDMNAVVLDLRRPGKDTKNPVALGSWRASFAIPDGGREVSFTLNNVHPGAAPTGEGNEGTVALTVSSARPDDVMAEFEAAKKVGREDRYVITGNILSGFDLAGGHGQIVNYTTDAGEIKPGILMSRKFSRDEYMKTRAVRLPTAKSILEFLRQAPAPSYDKSREVTSTDGYVKAGRDGADMWWIETSAGKDTGGKYFLDAAVRHKLGSTEFVKEKRRGGAVMAARNITGDQLRGALEVMIQKLDAVFEATEHQELATKIAKQEQPPKPQVNLSMGPPGEQRPAAPFYSAVLRAVETARNPRASPEQWLATLKNTPGIKQEELDWLGLEDWLKAQSGSVTRDALAEFVRANQIEVTETDRGGTSNVQVVFGETERVTDDNDDYAGHSQEIEARTNEAGDNPIPYTWSWDDDGNWALKSQGNTVARGDRDDMPDYPQLEAIIRQDIGENEGGATAFETYTLPGGHDYHELLLTLPLRASPDFAEKPGLVEKLRSLNDQIHRYVDAHPDAVPARDAELARITLERDRVAREMSEWRRADLNKDFRSSHFDTPNVLVHVRFNTRAVPIPYTAEEQAAIDAHAAWKAENDRLHEARGEPTRRMLAEVKARENARRDRLDADYRAGRITAAQWREGVETFEDRPDNETTRAYDAADAAYWAHIKTEPPLPTQRTSRVLFIEEIQSDWHKAGRKRGYGTKPNFAWTYGGTVHDGFETERAATEAAARELGAIGVDPDNANVEELTGWRPGGVPDAPFKTTWHELAFKRMVRWAAENGYDQIAWTPGIVQVDRYQTTLRQRVASIEWAVSDNPKAPDLKEVAITPHNGDVFTLFINERGVVVPAPGIMAPRARGWDHIESEAEGETIESLVGKEIATRIMGEESGTIEGDNLTIGGKGYSDLYDKALVKFADKIGKKFGAKVGQTKINTGNGQPMKGGYVLTDVHALPITDAMRDSVMQGQPLFSKKPPAGNLIFTDDKGDVNFAYNGEPAFARAGGEAAKLLNDIRSLLTRMLGTNLPVFFFDKMTLRDVRDRFGYDIPEEGYGSGGLDETVGGIASRIPGMPFDAFIALALGDPGYPRVWSAAAHEGSHILWDFTTPEEQRVIRADADRGEKSSLRRYAGASNGMAADNPYVDTLPIEELFAHGYEEFARQTQHQEAAVGLAVSLRRIYGKILRALAAVKRYLLRRGYDSVEQIWDAMYRGGFRPRREAALKEAAARGDHRRFDFSKKPTIDLAQRPPRSRPPPPERGELTEFLRGEHGMEDEIFKLQSRAQADVSEMAARMRTIEKAIGKRRINGVDTRFYYHAEDLAGGHLSTPELQREWAEHAQPLRDIQSEEWVRAKALARGQDLTEDEIRDMADDLDPEYMHRVAKGHAPQFDVLEGHDQSGNPVFSGRSLARSTTSMRTPVYFAMVAKDNGERMVVSAGRGGIQKWFNGAPEPPFKGSAGAELQIGKTFRIAGREWTVARARTPEIETHTPTRYHKSFFANTIDNILRLRRVIRALEFVRDLKTTPEFQALSRPLDGKHDPSWKQVDAPGLRGLWIHPRIANPINDYLEGGARVLKGRFFDGLEKINRLAVGSLFWSPIPHAENVAAHWFVGRGFDWITPYGARSLFMDGSRALASVISEDELYRDYLRSGASLIASRVTNRNFIEQMMKALGHRVIKQRRRWVRIANVLGFGGPLAVEKMVKAWWRGTSRILWMANDVFMLQRIIELERKGLTRAQAIKEAGTEIPDYRLPSEIMGSRGISELMQDPNLFMFSRYHYGIFKAYAGNVRKLTGRADPRLTGTGRAKGMVDGVGQLIALGMLVFVIYPAVNGVLQAAFQNKDVKAIARGPASFPQAAMDLFAGKREALQVFLTFMSPSPVGLEIVEQAFNKDLYITQYGVGTGRPAGDIVKGRHQGWQEVYDRLFHAVGTIPLGGQIETALNPKKGPGNVLAQQIGVSLP